MSRSEYRAEDAITVAISPEEWNSADPPAAKRPRASPEELPPSISSRSRSSGKIFFKTKLCGRFRAGICNFSNCSFAHGMEELRRPEPREEMTIPVLGASAMAAEGERFNKGRRCKKFYTGEGCPYGDSCSFVHDEQGKERESVAITVGSGGGGAQKPSNWKTRICNKWEVTGYCPFGSKCHFAHGSSELHKYGGGLVEAERRESSTMASPATMAPEAKALVELPTAGPLTAAAEIYHRTSSGGGHRGQRPSERWRGPEKISKIYGDWIDDND